MKYKLERKKERKKNEIKSAPFEYDLHGFFFAYGKFVKSKSGNITAAKIFI